MLDNRRHLIWSCFIALALPLLAQPLDAQQRVPAPQGPGGQREYAIHLLQQARQAMNQGDLEQADRLAAQAESLNVKFDSLMRPFADSPARVRKDLEKLRKGGAVASSGQPARGGATQPSPNGANRWMNSPSPATGWIENPHAAGAATHPLLQARLALAEGQIPAARQLLQQAQQPGIPQLAHDTPAAVDKAIRRAEALAMQATQGVVTAATRRNQAILWLDQAEALMQYGQVDMAAGMIEQASQLQARFNPGERTPEQLLSQLQAMQGGAQPEAELPPVVPAAGSPAEESPKQTSLRLMAQAKSALDRSDVATANKLVQKALKLGVPASAYAPGEMQPWLLQMQIDKAMQRQGGVVTASVSDDEVAGDAFPVQAGVYDPNEDASQVRLASVSDGTHRSARAAMQQLAQSDPPATLPIPADEEAEPVPSGTHDTDESAAAPDAASSANVPSTGQGMRLFEAGNAAIQQQDLNRARDLFRQAWAFEEELDPESRQRLQDHLQLLNVSTGDGARNRDAEAEADSPQRTLVRSLYQEITREQIASEQSRAKEPKAAWERLKTLRDRVASAEIDDTTRQQLLRRVERSLDEMQTYIDANRATIELDERNAEMLRQVELRRRMKLEKQDQLAKLVEEFNGLMDQQRYAEAGVVAKKARELDSKDVVVENMMWKSHFAQRMAVEYSLQDRGQRGFNDSLDSTRESSIPFDDREPFQFPDKAKWEDIKRKRGGLAKQQGRSMSEADRYIHESLRKKVQVSFEGKPLSEVMDTLAKLTNINVVMDPTGLAAEGITTETPVTLNLSNSVELRSALNLILEPLRLNYAIENEVLRITSEQNKEADVYPVTYPVADLVIPIPNFSPTYYMGLPAALRESYNMLGYGGTPGGFNRAPLTVMANNNATQQPNASVLAQMAGSGMLPSNPEAVQSGGAGPGGLGGGAQADFDSLINLIIDTIEPDSWEENGLGEGKISQFDSNLSLVIRQTEDVHEEIADLLEQLRRLQDLQVTIEVRFITLNDNFFERIGVDFDFNIDDNVGTLPAEDDGPAVTVGIDPAGNLTPDLDLQFTQGSFGQSVPAFGSFDANTAANFGFAVLSDIEAFFVIQAAQGDTRTNVLQAPKVTLFNGQQASIQDQAQRPFVISVIPVVGDFAAAHQPVIAVLSEGTSLNVQAVVSNDRRFVRLTLNPFFSTIGDVDTFQFEGTRRSNSGTTAVDPTDEEETVQNGEEDFVEGTTVQLPTLAFTTVGTTVSVPDGGTILLGGIKRLREGRSEAGVPLLNKIPFVNRLFNNVGIGREASSLMMMVTPRIIIQEEEEENLGIAGN